jgi:hypothetical protein
VAYSHGWSCEYHSAERWDSNFTFIRDGYFAQLLVCITSRSFQICLTEKHRIDISGSFIFDSAPFFPPPRHLLTTVTNRTPTVPSLQRWNSTFPDLSDITDFLGQAANLTSYIDDHASDAEMWKDDLFASKTFNAVVHQLLSLQRHFEGDLSSPALVMRESIRRACMILFGLLRDKFSVRPSGILQHKNKVKELLVQHLVDWSEFLELRLWVLLTASLAAEDEEISWYIEEIKGVMVLMELATWNEVVGVAKGILWMEETFKVRSDRLKELFELPAEELLTT